MRRFAVIVNAMNKHGFTQNLLEVVECLLPIAVALDPDFDAAEYHLFATSEVDAKLHNIAISNLVGLALNSRLRKPYVVQEGAGT